MRHDSSPCSTVPVRLTSRYMHHIANHQLPWCFAFSTDEARSHRDCQDLSTLVRVPECSCAGSEADIIAHAVLCCEDGVHVYGACERLRGLLRGGVRFVSGTD